MFAKMAVPKKADCLEELASYLSVICVTVSVLINSL